MGKTSQRDFLVDTMGNCFLCSKQIPVQPQQFSSSDSITGSASHPIHSLQQLSRYLKMDLSKVFQVKGLIQENLLVTVINSQLKVSLCKVCARLNEKLSGLCRQLEKIEMDVMHCLELVNKSLEVAIAPDNQASENIDSNSEQGKWASSKMEIAAVLRKEAIKKCSRKLGGRVPRTKLQKLTTHQVYEEMMKIKLNVTKSVESEPIPASFDDDSEPEFKIAYLKQEPLLAELMTNEHENDNPEGRSTPEFDDEWLSDVLENTEEDRRVFEKTASPDPLESPVAVTSQSFDLKLTTQQKWKPHQRRKYFGQPLRADKRLKAIVPPIKLAGVMGKPKGQCSLNQATGKYRCRHCPKEYTEERNFDAHYKRVHLDVKFKCVACSRIFLYKHHYDTHYLEVHAGATFKCTKCSKTFHKKWKLRMHDMVVHLGLEYRPFNSSQVPPPIIIEGRKGKPKCSLDSETDRWKCELCPSQFKSTSGFQTHYLTSHLGQRFGCPLCLKQFTQKAWYARHYFNFHVDA